MGAPKIPEPPAPPAPPPPPTATADRVRRSASSAQVGASSKKRGVSALTIRRPSVNVGGGSTGANLSY